MTYESWKCSDMRQFKFKYVPETRKKSQNIDKLTDKFLTKKALDFNQNCIKEKILNK